MKLLFDENLSPKLPRLLAAAFPGSLHVRDCGLKGCPDEDLWAYARANGFTVISKDSDFCQRSVLTLTCKPATRSLISWRVSRTWAGTRRSACWRPPRFASCVKSNAYPDGCLSAGADQAVLVTGWAPITQKV